jgi:hypothetical protein
MVLNVPQQAIAVGVPGFGRPEDVSLARMMAVPFDPEAPLALPDDSPAPENHGAPPTRLLP